MPFLPDLANDKWLVFVKRDAFDALYNIYLKNFESRNLKKREYSVIWFRQMWGKLNYIAGMKNLPPFSILDIENIYNSKRPLYGRLQFEAKTVFSKYDGKYYKIIVVDSFNFRIPYTDIYGGRRVTLTESTKLPPTQKIITRLTESDLSNIVKKAINKVLNENLFTHDDEYNIYEKLDELDIKYDYINDYENIIEINTPNDEIKKKAYNLCNYYGWKIIKDCKYSICAERIYGDRMNDFYDLEADKDDDYPHGVGIYYHFTPSYKVSKILKQGLTVREGNKLGYARGKRTYLISYPGIEFANILFRDRDEKTNVTILLVDMRKYLGKQINIYHDDFTDDEGAVYTYDYIPPECISIYDTIVCT